MTDERQQLEKAIAELEAQRGVLSEDAIDASITTLREKLAALQTPSESLAQQRKQVTILFADIVNSTNMVKHIDPEDALEIMDGALKHLATSVETHGGHVTRFMGDGFIAMFGAHVARENDPEMAVRAGLSILEKARECADELLQVWQIKDFQVRVGVNTGLVALGGMTEAEFTVMGSTVNLAKRMESAAPPGSVLISHNTYRHIQGIFEVEPILPVEAKGFDEPVSVFVVLRVKPRSFWVKTCSVEGVETRMIGREAELIALQKAYANAIEGKQTQVVTVVGEAGVGKSRLLYEFQNWLELLPEDLHSFQGRGRLETQNLPYAMLRDVFTFRFQIQDSDSATEVLKKLEEGFGEVFCADDVGQMRAHIVGQLLGFDLSKSQHVKAALDDPQQIHNRALMYLTEYFQCLEEQAPVVIFLEDIHWTDDSSLDMLNRLVHRIPEHSILIVCSARHRLYDRRPHWGEGLLTHHRVDLQPLTKHDGIQLVTEILQKVDQVPDAIQNLLVNRAEGNPFYIEELIKMLIEDGVIITGEEWWQVKPDRLAHVKVPDTLTGVLQARLEGLPQEERNTLQQASAVGHIFWDEAVEFITNETSSADVLPTQPSTGENLSSLHSRELIYHQQESTFEDVAEYTFKHAILRDVTYESVLKRVRKAYHGLVAEWLIEHSGERAGEYAGLIANHLELAGKNDQAAIFLYRAGEEAANRFANFEAVEYFTRGLDLTPEDDLGGQFDFYLAREKVLDLLGKRKAQHADLVALHEHAEVMGKINNQAQVAYRQVNYYVNINDLTSLENSVEHAKRLAQAAGDVECEAKINLRWGMFLWPLGRYQQAITQLERALSLSQAHQIDQVEADSLRVLGIIYGSTRSLEEGISYYEQALVKSRQIGYKRGEVLALNNLGVTSQQKGNLPSAREYFNAALQIQQTIGNRLGEAVLLGNLGEIEGCVYDYHKAFDLTYQALAISREVNSRLSEQNLFTNLGQLYLKTGNFDRSIKQLKLAKSIAEERNDIEDVNLIKLRLMSIYSSLGDFNQASNLYEQVKEVWQDLENPFDRSLYALMIGGYLHQIGSSDDAEKYSRQSFQFKGHQEDKLQELLRIINLAFIIEGRGNISEAKEIYRQAVSLSDKLDLQRQTIEAQAGLARISIANEDMKEALAQVNEILAYMHANTPANGSSFCLDGTEDPFRILLTCYQVLKANDDPRVNPVLTDAYNLQQARAANISDEHLRDCFLNNVTVNREIVEAYEASGL